MGIASNIAKNVGNPPICSNIGGRIGLGVDSSEKTVALIGDSITGQNTSSNDREYLSQGYFGMLNAITGQRYDFPTSYNLGVSSDTLSGIEARKTDLAALSPAPDIVVVLGGSNDVPAATTEASMKSDLDSIYDYITGTIGARVIALTIPPRTQTGGTALTGAQQTKLDNVNDYIMTKSGEITPVNIYSNMHDGSDNPLSTLFENESGKLLHPNPAGALQMAKDIKSALSGIYGSKAIPDMTVDNLLSNDNLSGTGGTISGPLTGDVADSNTLYTYAQATGTASKPTSNTQQIDVNYSNNLTYDTIQFYEADVTSGYTAGSDAVVAEAEIEILNVENVEGIWVEVTDEGSSNLQYKGLGKFDDPSFPTEARTYYMRTPEFTVQASNTALAVKIRGELNSSGGKTARLNFIIKQVRLKKLD